MHRYLPWKTQGLASLFSTIFTWGLIEALRTGIFAAYLLYNAQELGIGVAAVGVGFTINFLADSFFRGPGGFLVSRFGLGWMVFVAALSTVLVTLLLPFLSNVWLLWLVCGLWGMSLSAVNPGLMTLSSRLALHGREGRALTYTGAMIGPFIGVGLFATSFLVQNQYPYTQAILVGAAVLGLLVSLPSLFVRESIQFDKQELYPWRKLLIFIPAAFGQTFAPNLVGLVILKFADMELGLALWQQIAAVGLGGVLVAVGTAILGRIPDRRGPKNPLIVGVALIGVAMLWLGQKPDFAAVMLIALIGGVGFSLFGPSWNALVIRLLPQQNRAGVWGTLMVFEGLGYGFGPTVGTFLWETFNPSAPFVAGGLIWLGLAVFYIFALRGVSWKS